MIENFSNKEKNGLLNFDNKENERFIYSDEIENNNETSLNKEF